VQIINSKAQRANCLQGYPTFANDVQLRSLAAKKNRDEVELCTAEHNGTNFTSEGHVIHKFVINVSTIV